MSTCFVFGHFNERNPEAVSLLFVRKTMHVKKNNNNKKILFGSIALQPLYLFCVLPVVLDELNMTIKGAL